MSNLSKIKLLIIFYNQNNLVGSNICYTFVPIKLIQNVMETYTNKFFMYEGKTLVAAQPHFNTIKNTIKKVENCTTEYHKIIKQI